MSIPATSYSRDLAYLHDVGFDDFAEGAAAWVLRGLRVHGIYTGLIVDLGCGSGVFAERVTHAGCKVLGVNASASMLALTRKPRRLKDTSR